MPGKSKAHTPGGQALLLELGRRLRALREGQGRTLSELARVVGLSRRHLTEVEAGRANPSITCLQELCDGLGIDLVELFGGPSRDGAVARGGRIALVGLRGAGKSSVGRALALALEVPFVELDQRVEELAGLPLAQVFELHGSAGFRRLESDALERVLAEGERLVLAAGGSIVTSPESFARLRRTCHTVWLRTEPEVHLERVSAQGDRRPMAGRPRALDELKELLAEREPLYGRCELTLETTGRAVEQVVAPLVERFGAR